MTITAEELAHTRTIANALLLALRGFGCEPTAEISLPHRLLRLCNEIERLDRACWQLAKERDEANKAIGKLKLELESTQAERERLQNDLATWMVNE